MSGVVEAGGLQRILVQPRLYTETVKTTGVGDIKWSNLYVGRQRYGQG